jgi:hypothetical protein
MELQSETQQTISENPPVAQAPVDPAVLASAAVAKRRGRHVKDCTCDKCQAKRASGANGTSTAQSVSGDPVEVVTDTDRKIASQAILGITRGADCIATIIFDDIVETAKLEPRKAEKILAGVAMQDDLRTGFQETGVACAEKHGCVKIAPELGLIALGVAYVGGLLKLARDVKRMAPPIEVESEVKSDDRPEPQKQS